MIASYDAQVKSSAEIQFFLQQLLMQLWHFPEVALGCTFIKQSREIDNMSHLLSSLSREMQLRQPGCAHNPTVRLT